ncbi:hypothetical protein ACHAW5_001940 [Stephanodiscus triporus]|uniref:HSF-type DNA-binding domain-containing protein n=1 Tax=Stephanodiscus triporus TaxID=2934178 RepID=A0ABD3ME05_9STRA
MGFPIKKRINTLMETPFDGVSGLDILSAAIDSRLLQHREFSLPSSSVTKSTNEGTVVSVASPSSRDEDSTISSSDRSSPASVAASSSLQQRRNVVVASSPYHPIPTKQGKRSRTFPKILMEILSNPDNEHIIGWSPSGRSFAIHDPALFSLQILPKYFRRVIFRSFIRKLNRWGFRSIRRSSRPGGPDSNTNSAPRFEHRHFLRDDPEMCARIFCRSHPGASRGDNKKVDGGGDDDESNAGEDDAAPADCEASPDDDDKEAEAFAVSPSASAVGPFPSAAASSALTDVVLRPPPSQLLPSVGACGVVGGLVLLSSSHRQNEEFRALSNGRILLDLQRRRYQALLNRVHMMQMKADADILSQVVALRQQMMLSQRR